MRGRSRRPKYLRLTQQETSRQPAEIDRRSLRAERDRMRASSRRCRERRRARPTATRARDALPRRRFESCARIERDRRSAVWSHRDKDEVIRFGEIRRLWEPSTDIQVEIKKYRALTEVDDLAEAHRGSPRRLSALGQLTWPGRGPMGIGNQTPGSDSVFGSGEDSFFASGEIE